MNTDKHAEIWADVRHYWRTRDLPMLLAEAGDAVVKKVAEKMEERRRWSQEDEG